MRLVEGVKYRIEGNFFRRVHRPTPVFFQGQLAMDTHGLGSLSGAIVDKYGLSTFRGNFIANIHSDRIEFSKQYDFSQEIVPRRVGSGRTIKYCFTHNISGGWVGGWTVVGGSHSDQGSATMSLVPWEYDFTISHDLMDYLTLLEACKSR